MHKTINKTSGTASVGAMAAFTLMMLVALTANIAHADEALIRKNLSERLPSLPKIDEVSKTPMAGLWEVRMGNEVVYTDAQGNHLIQGNLYDTKTRTDLTAERLEKLSAIDFATLPLKDAMVVKQGSGARKMAVFADPNCGYCKRFERDLLKLKDVTIYTFLYPILGEDSEEKARNIWCSVDAQKAWRDWMIEGRAPVKQMGGKCDASALERNAALGRKHRVNGTPAVVLEDGTRKGGALPLAELEKLLAATKPAATKPL